MFIFAALSVSAIAFCRRYLPETKGHSVEQLTRQLEEDARAARSSRFNPPAPRGATA